MASCSIGNQCKSSTKGHMGDKVLADYVRAYEIDGKTWYLPYPEWIHQGEGIRNFVIKPDDVWVMTQPRSGTTLTQELVWLLENNLDFETAKRFQLVDRSPEFYISLIPELWEKCRLIRPSAEDPKVLESVPVDASKYSYEVYADLPSPRIFKTHLALSVHKGILDTGCKVVYCFRNPKDALVSRARFGCCGKNPLYKGDLESYIKIVIGDSPPSAGPYLPHWEHVKEAWEQRHHPNLLFMYYEEYRNDLPAAIKKVAAFLGKEYSDEQLAKLADHLEINNFRKNPMVNGLPGWEDRLSTFIGEGKVGGWTDVVSPELERKIDLWIEENTKGTDIMLPYLKNSALSNQCENSTEENAGQTETPYTKAYQIDGKTLYLLAPGWDMQGEGFRNFVIKPDDVFVMTQLRSGTTLTQELVWLLTNNLDFETAKRIHLIDRAPAFMVSTIPEIWKKCGIVRRSAKDPKVLESVPVDTSKYCYEVYADLPSPRTFKTHLPLWVHRGILDTGCKIVYVLRNPKDALLSRYRLATGGPNPIYKGNLESFIRAIINDEPCVAGPFLPYWPSIKAAWEQRHHPNLLFMRYEEYRADLPKAIRKIAAFLGKDYNDEELAKLADHLDINNFRKNPMVNGLPGWDVNESTFVGEGKVGGWTKVISPELEREIDLWMEENTKGTDIALPYLKK